MPARTNVFQDVVAILHQHMAEGTTVEESALLADRLSGHEREVDVVIRSTIAGYETIVSVEATSGRRRADIAWVEQMVAKHAGLPTHKLVLVSQAGFTAQALKYAQSHGAVALSPELLGEGDPAGAIVNKLQSIWPKLVALTLEQVRIVVERSEEPIAWFTAQPDHLLFLEDGTEVIAVVPFLQAQIGKKWPNLASDIGLATISEDQDCFFKLELEGPHVNIEGVRHRLFVRYELADPPELHAVHSIEVTGPAHVEVREVQLQHGRLGTVTFSQGRTTLADRDALLIATEGESGGKLSMRFREAKKMPRRGRRRPKRS
jgi:hypothetical protein